MGFVRRLPRLQRIAYLAQRSTLWFMNDLWTRKLAMLAGEGPPERSAVPRVDDTGADHAEIPDPPYMLEVGWRTTR